jgi:hypothetical protein
MKKLDSLEASYRCCAWGFWLFIILVLVGFLTSCTTTRVVTVERVKNDTTYITKQQRDSIWLHDSIHVSEKGDTIRIERWRTKYISKEVHDTLYQSVRDSIPVPYEVIKEVPAKLSSLQTGLMVSGLFAILALILVVVCKLKNKFNFLP